MNITFTNDIVENIGNILGKMTLLIQDIVVIIELCIIFQKFALKI